MSGAIAYVVVSRNVGDKDPAMAVGPYVFRREAERIRDLLDRTTSGIHSIVPCHYLNGEPPNPESVPLTKGK